ncbi:Hypothetical Protein FCC1311_080082 [Hondaea fermentalgiana]|uniref:Uncharacterized protein n=1 Tax=Hondaea fermentalgiana TaxID=2315210 RepID=A0A2R5GT04_9STRA|nr:Hypothetical Protein FCC1311_080082 [Hondaea fermentalgiana]|eukprot:GBG31783.1 Hypothetical Protein FCC1311_080082 [Hondaea fermentalgiana]
MSGRDLGILAFSWAGPADAPVCVATADFCNVTKVVRLLRDRVYTGSCTRHGRSESAASMATQETRPSLVEPLAVSSKSRLRGVLLSAGWAMSPAGHVADAEKELKFYEPGAGGCRVKGVTWLPGQSFRDQGNEKITKPRYRAPFDLAAVAVASRLAAGRRRDSAVAAAAVIQAIPGSEEEATIRADL